MALTRRQKFEVAARFLYEGLPDYGQVEIVAQELAQAAQTLTSNETKHAKMALDVMATWLYTKHDEEVK